MRIPILLKTQCFLLAGLLAIAVPPAPLRAAPPLTGQLEYVNGMRVLRLWGTHYQQGYAHGNLLAEEIVDLLENYMIGRMYALDMYFYTSVLFLLYARVPVPYQLEIAGLYQGMKDSLGEEGLYSPQLKRGFGPLDLLRWNMLEVLQLDFETNDSHAGGMCSSFSAWGDATADGALIMARNLDFGYPDDMLEQSSLLIAYEDHGRVFQGREWISFAWPGLIACGTGMNEDGVGAAAHYSNSNPNVEDLFVEIPRYYTPLGFVLRDVLESRRDDPLLYFYLRIALSHTAGSYNIHVFRPHLGGDEKAAAPAAVIEGNHLWAVARTPAQNSRCEPRLDGSCCLAATNHHRLLLEPVPCERYEKIVQALNGSGAPDMQAALTIASETYQYDGPFHTMQIMAFNADTREFMVSFADGSGHAYEKEPIHFFWEDIFR